MSSDTPNTSCPIPGTFPTVEELKQGLGEGPAIVLYTFSVGVFVINLGMFIFLINRFIREIPSGQVSSQCWVASLPTGLAFCQFLMLFLPNASEFLLTTFRLYEAVVIYKFVDLTMMCFGGEQQVLDSVGKNPIMRFNLPPCCCFLLCLKRTLLTRKKLVYIRLLVSQMLYVQIFVMFMQQVLHYNNIADGLLSSDNPNTFLNVLGRVSFFAGFWGLFIIFNIEYTFKLLEVGKFKVKFFLMKSPLFIFISQEILIEVLVATGAISCGAYLSTSAMGNIVTCSAIMLESSVLGVLYFIVYYRNPRIERKYVGNLPATSSEEDAKI